jgi:hypothetical protein
MKNNKPQEIEVTKEQFKALKKLFESKLKFVAIENMLNSIKILPQETIEINSVINIHQPEDPEVKIVAETPVEEEN